LLEATPARLTAIFEITERWYNEDSLHAREVMKKLTRWYGWPNRDFGTGHSSLEYLKQFPRSPR